MADDSSVDDMEKSAEDAVEPRGSLTEQPDNGSHQLEGGHSDHPSSVGHSRSVSIVEDADAPGAQSDFFCIAVGASAGGLEAISALLASIKPDMPAAIITAQHMAPQHRSMLAELLAKNSRFQVVNITDGMTIRPGTVYVNPPSKDVVIADGELRILTPSIQVGPRPSIDKLFHTVAEYYGPKSVGVVLSGTGSDGTVGCKAIRSGPHKLDSAISAFPGYAANCMAAS